PTTSPVTSLRPLHSPDDLLSPPAELVLLTIEATAFLKHMVRNIVGTLVEVGHGRRVAGSVEQLLELGDRTGAGQTAPAHGLCLDEVFYLPGNADPRVEATERSPGSHRAPGRKPVCGTRPNSKR